MDKRFLYITAKTMAELTDRLNAISGIYRVVYFGANNDVTMADDWYLAVLDRQGTFVITREDLLEAQQATNSLMAMAMENTSSA